MVDLLERDVYTEAAAARLLRVAAGTLHYWLEGGIRRNKVYQPIIRERATGKRTVTWAEFVEAGLLREYRKHRGIPMTELRTFIERLRDRFGVPYPLAHFRPYTSGRDLVLKAQEEANLSPDFSLVAEVKNQLVLLSPAEAFVKRVTWLDGVAAQWRPDEYPDSPVVINPKVRFGAPTVGGVRTETLWEQSEAGEDEHDLADLFGLTVGDVRKAIAYELATRPPAA